MKYYNVLVMFLDEDLDKSSKSFSDRFISPQINHINGILMSTLMYYVGIRSKRFYDYYFSKEKYSETIEKYFTNYPLKTKPQMKYNNSKEFKWCKMCLEHFEYMVDYLRCLCSEHRFRFNKGHPLERMVDFYYDMPMQLALNFGLTLPQANIKKITLPWKNLPPQFRKKDIVLGYRLYYLNLLPDKLAEYLTCKRDIPEWVNYFPD